ncbi:hypothetical protein [Nocardioides alcanivorans]|uniref:hypothetical protein n=1 Tax=Nocardioides alcanivorans TaxID=2897352 RepID=UPI001F1BD73A|nr:hypothetical protein [Nocardioides alcanivorans]
MTVSPHDVLLRTPIGDINFAGTEARALRVERRWFRWQLVVESSHRLGGLTRSDALALADRLARFVAEHEQADAYVAQEVFLSELRRSADRELTALVEWAGRTRLVFNRAQLQEQPVAPEDLRKIQESRPEINRILEARGEPGFLAILEDEEQAALLLHDQDLEELQRLMVPKPRQGEPDNSSLPRQ